MTAAEQQIRLDLSRPFVAMPEPHELQRSRAKVRSTKPALKTGMGVTAFLVECSLQRKIALNRQLQALTHVRNLPVALSICS